MSRRKVRISPQADRDIDGIADFIRRDNPRRAYSFVKELYERIGVVAERPFSYPSREDVAAGLRTASQGNYRILFRVEDELVQILRVLHAARDIDNLL